MEKRRWSALLKASRGSLDTDMADRKWISKATKNKGGLHRSLGVPEGKKIPPEKLAKASKSKNPKIRKQAALAKTLKGFRHE